jgi:hypothetical protein
MFGFYLRLRQTDRVQSCVHILDMSNDMSPKVDIDGDCQKTSSKVETGLLATRRSDSCEGVIFIAINPIRCG